MKALVKIGPNIGFKYFDNVEIADPIEDQCQIKIKLVSICGSDLNIWK
jgi:threonine dehydrogenase-like Zn-dependent dehydrogenase